MESESGFSFAIASQPFGRFCFLFVFLQKANVTVLSDSTCRDSYGQGDIADSMICVEVIIYTLSHMSCNRNKFLYIFMTCIEGPSGSGWPDFCQGDSGGWVPISIQIQFYESKN